MDHADVSEALMVGDVANKVELPEKGDVFDFLDDDKGPELPRWAEDSVELLFGDLPTALRKKLKGQLLMAAAPCYESPSPQCMRDAFQRIAQTLFDAAALRENQLLKISLMVWEASRKGGWFHIPDELRAEFGKQPGYDDVWSDQEALFRKQLTYWQGRLLSVSHSTSSTVESASRTASKTDSASSEAQTEWRTEDDRAGANSATIAQQTRAQTVARLIRELDDLKPQMFEDEAEYERLRVQYPDFLTFKIAAARPHLKAKILAIRGSTRHIRLAQELAGAHHGRELSTIKEDWKNHKPPEFRRTK
jgi:hypothetical protein